MSDMARFNSYIQTESWQNQCISPKGTPILQARAALSYPHEPGCILPFPAALTAGMNGHTSPPEIRQVPLSQEEQSARAANLSRFELELEFVQALANPHYLESLAVQGVLMQPAFVNYLNYLTYWLDKDKGYNQFVS